MDFKIGDRAEVIGKKYTDVAGSHWHAQMDKTIGISGKVLGVTSDWICLQFSDPINRDWGYHPNDLRLIPPQTESMDKKELSDLIYNLEEPIFRITADSVADKILEAFDKTPKAQPKPEPEDRRKGERMGEGRILPGWKSYDKVIYTRCGSHGTHKERREGGERRAGAKDRRVAHTRRHSGPQLRGRLLPRRSGKDRRQEKTECNCSDYCESQKVSELSTSLVGYMDKARGFEARIKELEEAGRLVVEQLESNYDESERRVEFFKEQLSGMKRLYQEALKKNEQYAFGPHGKDRQRIEELESELSVLATQVEYNAKIADQWMGKYHKLREGVKIARKALDG